MTAKTLPDARAIEAQRGDEYLAQVRAEAWRAGAMAMRQLAAQTVRDCQLPGRHAVLDVEILSLSIPEATNG